MFKMVTRVVLVSLILSSVSFGAFVPNANLLSNSGFEDAGLGVWFAEGAGGSIDISLDSQTGSQAAEVVYPSDYQGIRQDVGGVDDGDRLQTYVMSYSVKAANQDSVGDLIWCGLWEKAPSGWAFHNGTMYNLTADWQTYSFEIAFEKADMDGIAAVIQAAGAGSFLVDDVSLTMVPEPATMVILGLGSLLIRRKK